MAEKLVLANWGGIDLDDFGDFLVEVGLEESVTKQVLEALLVVKKAVKAGIALKTGNPLGAGPDGGDSSLDQDAAQAAAMQRVIDRWLASGIQFNRVGTIWLLSRIQHLDP